MTYGNSADSLTDAVQRMDGILYDERKENDRVHLVALLTVFVIRYTIIEQ